MDGKTDRIVYTAGDSMEKLNVEMNGDEFTIDHSYVLNGDLMYDPLISMKIDYEHEKVIPVYYESSGLGIYETYDMGNPSPEMSAKINSMFEHLDTWLDNIENQGYLDNPDIKNIEMTEKSHDNGIAI